MKNLFFAILAAFSLALAVAPAYAGSAAGFHEATRMQQTGSYSKE